MPDKSVPACLKLLRQVAFSCRFVAQAATLAFITALASVPAAAWAESDPGVVLVFGDSLSAAYRMDEEQGWVALLQRRVDTNGLDWQVQNASVSGETTSGGLARLPAVLDSTQPDIVILELGGSWSSCSSVATTACAACRSQPFAPICSR